MLTDREIEEGWHKTFSTSNPFCPCDLRSFTKAVRWAERAALCTSPAVDEQAAFERWSIDSGFNTAGQERAKSQQSYASFSDAWAWRAWQARALLKTTSGASQ